MAEKIEWLEVWIDTSSAGEYLLVLRKYRNRPIELVDPLDKWKIIRQFPDHEEASHWLNEDEYDMVEGRWVPFS
jgi:hypothetical protein